MSFDGVENRRFQRNAYFKSIKFYTNSQPHNRIKIGATVNIGDAGMCMYTLNNLIIDEPIIIKNTLPVPYQKAIVKYINKLFGQFFKVGIMFIK